MSVLAKKLTLIAIDSLAFCFLYAFIGAILLPESGWSFNFILLNYPIPLLLLFCLILVFYFSKVYLYIVRNIDNHFIVCSIKANISLLVVWYLANELIDLKLPNTFIFILALNVFFYLVLSRYFAYWGLNQLKFNKKNTTNILIFGAGDAGKQLLSSFRGSQQYHVVGIIDDDQSLQGRLSAGIPIFSREKLNALINKKNVSEIVVAIPSLSFSSRKNIISWLSQYPIKVKVIPSLNQILNGKVSFSLARSVSIEDILGRDEVSADPKLLGRCTTSKRVLITGAGGSIGSELAKQVLAQKPAQLILLDQSELALYQIEKLLRPLAREANVNLIPSLASVVNEARIQEILEQFKPETIYHAAAYKHVPLVEQNIKEGLFTNTFGTHTLAKLAAKHQVQNFLLISTDKAVRPTNFMGASKRLAELSIQALQKQYPSTVFSMVRFGNVLDSSGSVIPLFKEQIQSGGPITVTHPEITRYFMTIPEAVRLVLQASGMAKGGEVFVLEMGEPIKIVDLAKKMIELSGYQVATEENDGGIHIRYTGLRPGEKLFEELLIGDDIQETEHPRILKVFEDHLSLAEFEIILDNLSKQLKNNDYNLLKSTLKECVNGFNHNGEIVDILNFKTL